MNKQMNAAQVAKFMELLKNRIEAYQKDWSAVDKDTSEQWAIKSDSTIKATEFALQDFIEVLNND